MNTNEIENILRRAPQPKPPMNLKQKLKDQVGLESSLSRLSETGSGSWLARWWATLAPTMVSIACAAGLTVQRLEINDLKTKLKQSTEDQTAAALSVSKPVIATSENTGPGGAVAGEEEEIARLRDLAARLNEDVSKLEQVKLENERMRTQLASGSKGVFTAEETEALEKARERADRIRCVNNMKQLGLAVRVWSMDNHEMTPPNVLSLSNEIGTFKILVCPADTARQPARDAASFTPANCSYEFLAPAALENEPSRILFRCPIHGNLGMCDGSVQSGIGKEHPDWIVQLDGKYFLKSTEPPANAGNAPAAPPGQAQ